MRNALKSIQFCVVMASILKLLAILSVQCIFCLTLQRYMVHAESNSKRNIIPLEDCDPSIIPVMKDFDMKKFSGKWFELAKTVTGYIDVADGVWLVEGNNKSHTFRFSGRDNNQHCIRPIKGKISAAKEPPGLLTLSYKTYSTHVEENVRVLFTDYESIAVIYSCIHHVHTDKEVCHSAGIFGAIWTRKSHVDVEVYDKAVSYLEMACVLKSTLHIRNVIGPCKIEHVDPRIDDFPAPDYCYQMMDLGSCSGSLQRFYYDAKEKTCKQFKYGGCGGNNNNFMSLRECLQKCGHNSSKDPVCMTTAKCAIFCSPCCQEDKSGCVHCDCEHIIEDNFLNCVDSPSKCPSECDAELIYQGCHICKCPDVIIPEDEHAVCNEVKSIGNCEQSIERYYYNAIFDVCETFTYSGCGGNGNNFQTLQQCWDDCKSKGNPMVQQGPIYDPGEPGSSSVSTSSLLVLVIAFVIAKMHI